MSQSSKIEKLLGVQEQPKNEKKFEKLLGRSTFIKMPQSLIETQYLDLQKSKKFTAEIITDHKHKQNKRKNLSDQKENNLFLKYPTYKSLKNMCPKVFFFAFSNNNNKLFKV